MIQEINNKSEGFQQIIDIIHNNPEYYNGSYHKDTDISKILDCIYKTLFTDNHSSISLIVEKNSNNSLDLIVDVIKK